MIAIILPTPFILCKLVGRIDPMGPDTWASPPFGLMVISPGQSAVQPTITSQA